MGRRLTHRAEADTRTAAWRPASLLETREGTGRSVAASPVGSRCFSAQPLPTEVGPGHLALTLVLLPASWDFSGKPLICQRLCLHLYAEENENASHGAATRVTG